MIRKLLQKIFRRRKKVSDKKIPWPTPEQILDMPWFEGLKLDKVIVVDSKESAHHAFENLKKLKVVGFDTESKPTFVKGEKSTGPHIVQFSTLHHAYIFMLHQSDCKKFASLLIEMDSLKKVGFGLSDDIKKINAKLKIEPRSVFDVENLFTTKGYGRGVGVKVGVAIVFKKRFRKSKSASTSNWSKPQLSEKQLLYAANDAFAAVKVYHALT